MRRRHKPGWNQGKKIQRWCDGHVLWLGCWRCVDYLTFSPQPTWFTAFDMKLTLTHQIVGKEAVEKESTNKDYTSRGCCVKQMKCQLPYPDSWCLADGATRECRENGGYLEVAKALVPPFTFGICERTYGIISVFTVRTEWDAVCRLDKNTTLAIKRRGPFSIMTMELTRVIFLSWKIVTLKPFREVQYLRDSGGNEIM